MHRWKLFTLLLLAFAIVAIGCAGDDGSDGKNGKDGLDGVDGAQGPPGPTVLNASAIPEEDLEALEVVSEITGVVVASPPQVTFSLKTAGGIPITGIVPFWEDSSRYVRFTMCKLVPGTDGGPNLWVSYTRDASSNDPDYDTGSSLVDNEDGTYTFTFNTDVTNVAGVTWEPTLLHRVAGQVGASGGLEPQNLVYDYVPDGGAAPATRTMTNMGVCNACHDNLVFHGRRFKTEYCTQCHNQDLAEGEGDLKFMIHRIHSAGKFDVLDNAVDYSHLTYPQDLANCRKCHDGTRLGTPDGDNWMNVPSVVACSGCHSELSAGHGGGGGGQACFGCHDDGIAPSIETAHLTATATPHNPNLPTGLRNIAYELVEATVDGANQVTVKLKVTSDGTALDFTNLPTDLTTPGRYPGLLLAWALPQHGIDEPMDYNNIGRRAAQPLSLGLNKFSPIETGAPIGTITFDAGSGVNTVVVTDAASNFPSGATLRAIGLQGYFQQALNGSNVSLHTPSAVMAVTGDDARRTVVDSAKCANCHEWFEGHGGNRVYNIQICTLCHVPNLSSSGRTLTDTSGVADDMQAAIDAGTLDPSVDPSDATTFPEDAQNLKDMVHGIHSAGDRTRHFQHVRGGSHDGYYDWDHVTFPRGAETSNCSLCHITGSTRLPLDEGLLGTTVRTTGLADGQDATVGDAETAFTNVPNPTDWINTPTASSCFYCHTSNDAMAHMMQNGALLSLPTGGYYSNRDMIGDAYESCAVCHGPGKTADLEVVHDR